MNKKSSLFTVCILAASLSGCTYNLRGTNEENVRLSKKNQDAINKYFTPEAAKALRKIPVHYAKFDVDFAKGCSHLTTLDAMLNGVGYEPVTVYNYEKPEYTNAKETVSDKVIVHELTHHAIRQGLVDIEEFKKAYARASETPNGKFIKARLYAEVAQKYSIFSLWGDEDYFEEMTAYATAFILETPINWNVLQPVPDKMKSVYERLLKDEILHPKR